MAVAVVAVALVVRGLGGGSSSGGSSTQQVLQDTFGGGKGAGSGKFKAVERTLDWEVGETAIIVCR